MSSIRALRDVPRPEDWDELYLPTVKALVDAGDAVVDELRRISARQGLSSKPMAMAVWHLYRTERVTSGDLARKCGCDAGNLSTMLEKLEGAGLVERTACRNDRRVRYVRLTPKGRKIGAQVQREYKRSGIYNQLHRLTPRERDAFTSVLMSIVASSNS